MLQLHDVSVTFRGGTRALSGINLNFSNTAFTAMIGPSGAGKSTLLRIMKGLIQPSGGFVTLDGVPLGRRHSARLRRQQAQLGMVFQQFNLVRRLSALDNVLLGRLVDTPDWRSTLRLASRDDRAFALHLLDRVGLADLAWQRADQLSGGQQQRVGIARALAQRPRLILADEPISALDPKSAEQVMTILRDIRARDGIAVVANLHFLDTVREYADRVVALRAGQVLFDGSARALTPALTRELYYGDTPAEPSFVPQPPASPYAEARF